MARIFVRELAPSVEFRSVYDSEISTSHFQTFSKSLAQSICKDDVIPLKDFFHLMYLICLCPFHLRKKKFQVGNNKKVFTVIGKKNVVQRVICLIVQLLSILIVFTEVRTSIKRVTADSNAKDKSMVNAVAHYFQVFFYLWHLLLVLMIYLAWWRKSSQFCSLLKWIDATGSEERSHVFLRIGGRLCFIFCFGLCISAAFTGVISGVVPEDEMSTISSLSNIERWGARLVDDARYTFFFTDKRYKLRIQNNMTLTTSENGTEADEMITLKHIKVWEWCLAGVVGVAHLYRRLIAIFGAIFVAVGAVTLWHPAWKLSKISEKMAISEKNRNSERVAKSLCDNYKRIRYLAQKINCCYAGIILPFTLMIVFYYSVGLDLIFTRKDNVVRSRLLLYFGLLVFVLLMAADICGRLGQFQQNLFSFSAVSPTITSLIAYQIENHTVGIRAYNDVFTVSYGVLGEITASIITYSIVCAQYSSSVDTEPLRV